jgi:hypothetical protein
MDERRAHFHLPCTPGLPWIAPPLEKQLKQSYTYEEASASYNSFGHIRDLLFVFLRYN